MHLIDTIQKHLLPYEGPLLLGFSGGEDSLTLAHILLSLRKPFHMAHFDHAWREKSAEEAKMLEKWAQKREIPFFSQRSTSGKKSECDAREERYAFFEKLYRKNGYQALVLAHHQNDQAETVLKRVLEGAHLTTMGGIRPVSKHWGMTILRPLLSVPKREILSYIKDNQLSPIEDETNLDPHYLRGKMRTMLLPTLSEQFGKEICSSLERIGEYGAELDEYLREITKKYHPIEGPFGLMWDFREAHPIEVRYSLHGYFQASYSIFQRIINGLKEGKANYRVAFGKITVILDRGYLFWVQHFPPPFPDEEFPQQKSIRKEGWQWEIQEGGESSQSWQDLWKGKISLALAEKYEHFPAFLRPLLPKKGERNASRLTIEIKR